LRIGELKHGDAFEVPDRKLVPEPDGQTRYSGVLGDGGRYDHQRGEK
jgi:hypothetical protein